MSDAVWYYAQNDQERGPVTPAELRSLVSAGKLKGSDLVWKEGMEDWAAASQVKGLLPEPAAPPAPPDNVPRNRSPVLRDTPSREPAAPLQPREPQPRDARWIDGPPADDATPGSVPRVPMTAAPAAAVRLSQPARERRPAGEVAADVVKYIRPAGIGLVALGLLMVLAARGCDALTERYTARVIALPRVEEESFNQSWNTERGALEAEIAALDSKPRPSQGDLQALNDKRVELQRLNDEKSKEQQQLSTGRWAYLRAAAATAADDNRAWGFWRGIALVLGTLVLVPGLLVLAFVGQGTERWLSLALLAVVAFSLYVGGSAWSAVLGG
jgi:hypothetical protein